MPQATRKIKQSLKLSFLPHGQLLALLLSSHPMQIPHLLYNKEQPTKASAPSGSNAGAPVQHAPPDGLDVFFELILSPVPKSVRSQIMEHLSWEARMNFICLLRSTQHAERSIRIDTEPKTREAELESLIVRPRPVILGTLPRICC
jgi:hypothetical protein